MNDPSLGVLDRSRVAIDKLERIGVTLSDYEKEVIISSAILLEKALRKLQVQYPPGHGLEHTFRVLELAIFLYKRHGADISTIVLAALFHDIMRMKNNHAEEASKFVVEFLRGTEFEDIRMDVADIIREHSYSLSKKPTSLESKILQDADRLDALGAVGIARVFSFGGFLNRELYDPIEPKSGGSIKHFYDKILEIPKLLNTPTAKRIGTQRMQILRLFLDEFIREVLLIDIHNYLH